NRTLAPFLGRRREHRSVRGSKAEDDLCHRKLLSAGCIIGVNPGRAKAAGAASPNALMELAFSPPPPAPGDCLRMLKAAKSTPPVINRVENAQLHSNGAAMRPAKPKERNHAHSFDRTNRRVWLEPWRGDRLRRTGLRRNDHLSSSALAALHGVPGLAALHGLPAGAEAPIPPIRTLGLMGTRTRASMTARTGMRPAMRRMAAD